MNAQMSALWCTKNIGGMSLIFRNIDFQTLKSNLLKMWNLRLPSFFPCTL